MSKCQNRRKLLQSESLKLASENDLMEWSRRLEPAVIMGTNVEFGDSQLHQIRVNLVVDFNMISFCVSRSFFQWDREGRFHGGEGIIGLRGAGSSSS